MNEQTWLKKSLNTPTSDPTENALYEEKGGSICERQESFPTVLQTSLTQPTVLTLLADPDTNIHSHQLDTSKTISEIHIECNPTSDQPDMHSPEPTKMIHKSKKSRLKYKKRNQTEIRKEHSHSSSTEELSTSTSEQEECEFLHDSAFTAIHVPLSCEILTPSYCVQVTDRYNAPNPIEQRSLTSGNVRTDLDIQAPAKLDLGKSHYSYMSDAKNHTNLCESRNEIELLMIQKDKVITESVEGENIEIKLDNSEGKHKENKQRRQKKLMKNIGIDGLRIRGKQETDEKNRPHNKRNRNNRKCDIKFATGRRRKQQKTMERIYEETNKNEETAKDKKAKERENSAAEKIRRELNCFKKHGESIEKSTAKKHKVKDKKIIAKDEKKEKMPPTLYGSAKRNREKEHEVRVQPVALKVGKLGAEDVPEKPQRPGSKTDRSSKQEMNAAVKNDGTYEVGVAAGLSVPAVDVGVSGDVGLTGGEISVPSKKSGFGFGFGGKGKPESKKARKAKKVKKSKLGGDVGAAVSTGVDVQVPDVSVDVHGGSGSKSVGWRFPKISFPKAKLGAGDVKGVAPVSLPSGEMKISGPKVEIPSVNAELNVPDVDVRVPDMSVGVDVREASGAVGLPSVSVGGDVNIPDVSVTAGVLSPDVGADVSVPDLGGSLAVDLDVPKMQVDASAPGVDVRGPEVHVPSVGVEVGQIGGADVSVKAPKLGFKFGRKGKKARVKANAGAPSVGTPEVDLAAGLSVPAVDVGVSGDVGLTGGEISVPSKKSGFGFGFGGKGKPESKKARKAKKVKKSKLGGDVGAAVSTGVDVQVPDVSVDVHGGSGSKSVGWRFPKISFPKAKLGAGDVKGVAPVSLPSGEMKISGPKVEIPSVNAELNVPDVDVRVPDMSVGVDVREASGAVGLPSVSVGGDVNIPDVSFSHILDSPVVRAEVFSVSTFNPTSCFSVVPDAPAIISSVCSSSFASAVCSPSVSRPVRLPVSSFLDDFAFINTEPPPDLVSSSSPSSNSVDEPAFIASYSDSGFIAHQPVTPLGCSPSEAFSNVSALLFDAISPGSVSSLDGDSASPVSASFDRVGYPASVCVDIRTPEPEDFGQECHDSGLPFVTSSSDSAGLGSPAVVHGVKHHWMQNLGSLRKGNRAHPKLFPGRAPFKDNNTTGTNDFVSGGVVTAVGSTHDSAVPEPGCISYPLNHQVGLMDGGASGGANVGHSHTNPSKLRWFGSLGRRTLGSPENSKNAVKAASHSEVRRLKPGDVESEGTEITQTAGRRKVKRLKKHRKVKKGDIPSRPLVQDVSPGTPVTPRTPSGKPRDPSVRQTWHGIDHHQSYENGFDFDSDGVPKPPATPTGIRITPVLYDPWNLGDVKRRGTHDFSRPRPWSALEIAPPGCAFVNDDYLFPDALTPTKIPSFRCSKDVVYNVPYMDDKALPIEELEWPLGESKRNLLSQFHRTESGGRIVAQEECSFISLDDKENQFLESDGNNLRFGRLPISRKTKRKGVKNDKTKRSSSRSKVSGLFSSWLHKQGEGSQ